MPASKEFLALLDDVEHTPGWRVIKIDASRFRVYPPPPHPVIFVSSNDHDRNVLAKFRRAGFERFKEEVKLKIPAPPSLPATPLAPMPPAPQPSPAPTPIAVIRKNVELILNSLTVISENLEKMEDDQKSLQQLKHLLGTVLK